MKTMFRSVCAGLTACLMWVSMLPVGAFAASGDYSVRVQAGKVNFLQGDTVVGSHAAASTDLIITSDRSGELLVQFPNSKGTYSNVTLGSQKALTVTGTANSVTLRSALPDDISLTFDAQSKISTLSVSSRTPVRIDGQVTLAEVAGAATLTVNKDGSVARARLRSSGASLKATGEVSAIEKVSGAQVSGAGAGKVSSVMASASDSWARSQSGLRIDNGVRDDYYWDDDRYYDRYDDRLSGSYQTATQGNYTVKTYTINAEYGDILDDLEGELNDAVRVYTRSGSRVYGELTWLDDGYTEVRGNRYYRFRFWPDGSRYDEFTGRVRVMVYDEYDRPSSSGSGNVYFDIQSIYTYDDKDRRLRDLEDDLRANVVAYSRSGDEVLDGEFHFTSPSTRPRADGYYSFTFTPHSSRYRKTTGRIYIYVL